MVSETNHTTVIKSESFINRKVVVIQFHFQYMYHVVIFNLTNRNATRARQMQTVGVYMKRLAGLMKVKENEKHVFKKVIDHL